MQRLLRREQKKVLTELYNLQRIIDVVWRKNRLFMKKIDKMLTVSFIILLVI